MNFLRFFITFVFVTTLGCKAQHMPTPKYVHHPLINGQIDSLEWSESDVVDVQNKYDLYVKQDEQYYYIAVKNKTALPFYVDIFLLIDESLFNIHSSAQLGERKLTEPDWDDSTPVTNWGYINDWTSNTVLFDRIKYKKLKEEGFEGNISLESVIPYDGFEFQFAKNTWNLDTSKMRIEMRNMVGIEDFEETIFPATSQRNSYDKWYELKFN